MHSWPNAPSTFPLPHVKSIPDIHTHFWPDAIQPSLFLRQVHFRCFIGLATVVGQSPIMYFPRSMCLSLSFLTLYISVRSLCLIICYPPFVSLSHPQFPVSIHPCLIYLYSISPSTLFSYPIHSLRTIPDRSDQPNPYHTHTCINTLVTSCCSPVW